MTLSLVGDLKVISEDRRQDWIDYFDEFQSERDGLFYDPAVMNDIYIDSDWWGARHLALHMISAYTDLRARPRHPLRFLRIYYDNEYMMRWLVQEDWNSSSIGDGDIDNKIMNVGCLLQYQRDYFSDDQAGKAVECLKTFLRSKINQSHGMWGGFDVNDAQQRSRMVQFAYHVFPIFIYDNEFDFDHGTICAHVMRTQNEFGGFGVSLNSSACEDIDSVDVLIRCSPFLQADLRREVDLALRKALTWIMMNQAADGGFVFRLFQPNIYGSRETSSRANVGEMLSTWFRTLCLAYLCRYLELKNGFVITTCPGCEIE